MELIRNLLKLYILLLIIDAILSYFPNLNDLGWRKYIKKLADYSCDPIRKKLPPLHLPIDVSPLIVIFLIELFKFLW